ncbi:putative membrane protein YfcA [Evansella vedderi]|uniref:Probable membrane transporter protein n=1 Tax=Evansella vedderi TaxID=38282 RepID=A0ABU0A3S5_9BACI|nr:sulfite exporter TauE/SafE family protein [Evansella vedderi]MDQ0257621.1 putative membrane protein YfcA [Evansella vedderi]
MEWFILGILGLIAAIFGSILGLGGGIIIVPTLMILSNYSAILNGITPQIAVGTSLMVMIFTALSSTLAYLKQKTVDYKSAFIFFIGSGPGALFGVWMNKGIQVDAFLILFGLFIILVSFILMVRKHIKPLSRHPSGIKREYINPSGKSIHYGYEPIIAIPIAFIVGICSGLFGIGGGSLMVPAMIILFGFPAHIAVATSMLMIFLSSIVSSISHISLGNVDWLYALALLPGAWVGGQMGAAINRRMTSDSIVNLLRFFLIIIGIRLIYQGYTGLF